MSSPTDWEHGDGWERGTTWERPTGGGGTPGRVALDSNDVIAYYHLAGFPSGPIHNSGSGGTLDLTAAGLFLEGPGQYGEVAVLNPATTVGTVGGTLYSGNTSTMTGESGTISLSAWVWLTQAVSYGADMPIFGKAANPSTWASPYHCALLGLLNDGTPEFAVRNSTAWVSLLGSTALSFSAWHHLGLTYDGTVLTAYVDGASIGTASGGAIDWSSHGGIFVGGWPNNSGYYDSPPIIAGDFRWATVVRSAGYFSSVWATRRTP